MWRNTLRSDWIRNVIQEFHSPSFRSENMLQFEALLLLGLIVARRAIPALEGRRRPVDRGVGAHGAGKRPACSALCRRDRADSGWTVERMVEQLLCPLQEKLAPGILNLMAADGSKDSGEPAHGRPIAVVMLVLMGPPVTSITRYQMAAGLSGFDISDHDRTRAQRSEFAIPRSHHRPVGRLSDLRKSRPRKSSSTAAAIFTALKWATITSVSAMARGIGSDCWKNTASTWPCCRSILALSQILKRRPEWRVVEDDGKRILLVRSTSR